MPAEPKEYTPKSKHYFSIMPDKLFANFDAEAHRKKQIETVLNSPAKASFRDHPHLVVFVNDKFVWDVEKVNNLDATSLGAIATLAFKRTENNNENY